jgi:hypothetical protein
MSPLPELVAGLLVLGGLVVDQLRRSRALRPVPAPVRRPRPSRSA